jgi:alkylation response protein AidB-like acyl-CoA dehydrogenase
VTEEMLAHRAPTRHYSTADRQSGPVLLRYGQDEVKKNIVPRICSGELCFCIGLSEPNSGSDVFAASTRATKTDGGWLVNGRKIWTSNAHQADYMIGLLRTSNKTPENHRHGLTQFLIDMK